MLVKEYLAIVKEVWWKYRGPFKFELLFIKTSIRQYIKYFNLKKYLKRIIFEENIILNILILFFIFKMIYDLFIFIFYTIDLYMTFFLKWFFYIVYISLDKWETYIFKKIYEVRKDPVKSKLYKREKALLAKSRATFFKRFAIDFEKDYDIGLKFDKRNYSIILKYYKYFSILFPSFYKWFIFSIRKNVPYLWKQIDIWISKVLIKRYLLNWSVIIKLFFFIIIKRVLIFYLKCKNFLFKIYVYIFVFLKERFSIYFRIYKIRRKYRLDFFKNLYINYFFFYKKRSYIENKIFLLSEKDLIKYTDESMSLTFNFYSFNFKIIYFWHCYIKNISYISYLENLLKTRKYYNDYWNCRIFIPINIMLLLTKMSYFLKFIIPIFNKYYSKYMTILKNKILNYSYKLLSLLIYILVPFILIFCLYENIKEFLKWFSLFIKILYKK